MKRLRIRKTDQIICYDAMGMFSVARAAWMFRYFGAQDVRIMSGGLKKWIAEGRETYSGEYSDGEGLEDGGDFSYSVLDASKAFTDINEVHRVACAIVNETSDWQITDARAPPRFLGEVPEPRPGIRSGNISGSVNIPF